MVLKRLVALVLLGACIAAVPAFADGIKLKVNGRQMGYDVAPVIENGRTLVPLRVIFEELGATLTWDAGSRTAKARKGSTEVSIQIGSPKAIVNGVEKPLDVPGKIIGGRTMVPVRFVSEAMGAVVDWDEATRTVLVQTPTVIDSRIAWNTTFEKAKSPYVLKEGLIVDRDVTLTIEPGTDVILAGGLLDVRGHLNVQGKPDAPVVIRGLKGSTAATVKFSAGDNTLKYTDFEVGTSFEKASNTRIENCSFSAAETALDISAGNGGSVVGCSFSGAKLGIHLSGTDGFAIEKCSFQNCGTGVLVEASKKVSVTQSALKGGSVGICFNGTTDCKVTHTDIQGHKECGYLSKGDSLNSDIRFNNFTDNAIHAQVQTKELAVKMPDNYWGTRKPEEIAAKIVDKADNPVYPKVDFEPFSLKPNS